jgi:hypothetical protein
MSYAHVDSIEALKHLRAALWKFVEKANQSLTEAEGDLQRTLNWLEHDGRTFWQGQIKRRTLDLNKAKESLRSKTAVTRRDGTKPSAVEERNAVARAQQRLQNAEAKLEKVKQYAKLLQREALTYRGQMQRMANAVQVEIPAAVAHLDALMASLADYTAPEEAVSTATNAGAPEQHASMRRPEAPGETGPAALENLKESQNSPQNPTVTHGNV